MPLKSRIPAIVAALPRAADATVERTARVIETDATSRVPVDTGALRTSIEVFGAAGSGERTVEAGQGLDYAPMVEFGTSRQTAQPFMTPAAMVGEKAMPRIAKEEVRKVIK